MSKIMWGTVRTATDLVAWKKEKGGERMMETHLPAEKKCTDVTVINIFLTFTLLPGSIKYEVVFNINIQLYKGTQKLHDSVCCLGCSWGLYRCSCEQGCDLSGMEKPRIKPDGGERVLLFMKRHEGGLARLWKLHHTVTGGSLLIAKGRGHTLHVLLHHFRHKWKGESGTPIIL